MESFKNFINGKFGFSKTLHASDRINLSNGDVFAKASVTKVMHLIARVNKGGTSRWLSVLMLGLREAGVDNCLYAGFVQSGEEEDALFNAVGGKRIQSMGRSISLFSDLRSISDVRKAIKNENPNVLNTHTAKAGLIGRIAAIGIDVKVVHTYHGHIIYGYFGKLKSYVFILIERLLGFFTNIIVVNGEKVKNELLENHIGTEKKYVVIYPGIPPMDFISKEAARNMWQLGRDEVVVGWLGRVTQIKRPDRIIETAKKMPEVKFLVGGVGDLFEKSKQNAPSNVVFLGWVKPEEFWPACDIAVLTSDNEASPIALIEAAYAGLPIVAENVGSVAETFQDKVGGFLTSNINDRVKAIKNFASDSALRAKMGKDAELYSREKFSVVKFLEKHLIVYDVK